MILTAEIVEEMLQSILSKMDFSYNIDIVDEQIIIQHNCSESLFDTFVHEMEEEDEEKWEDMGDYEKQMEFESRYCQQDIEAMDALQNLGFESDFQDSGYHFDFSYKHTIAVQNFIKAHKHLLRKQKIENLLNEN